MIFVKQEILKKKFSEYEMTKREIYKKFINLSEKELIQKITKTLTLEMMSDYYY